MDYIGKVVVFNSAINDIETDFSPGIKARIVGIEPFDKGTPDEHYRILFDLEEFVEENKHKWEANFYDKDHKPTLKYPETKYYKHRTPTHLSKEDLEENKFFKIVDDNNNKEIQDTTDFIFWQMLQVIESRAKENDVLDRDLVKQAYKHWNRLHPVDPPVTPRWDRK